VLIRKTRIPVKQIVLVGLLPSFLKKLIYRMKGYRIGKGVKLAFGSVLIGKKVEIGMHSSIGFFTIVRADEIRIGRYVKIGALSAIDTGKFWIDDDARINEQVYIGGTKTPESALVLGKRTIIMQASYINPTMPITVGDDSGIGGHCLLFTHGSWNSQLEGYPVKFAPISIGKKVWLPWRVFIMPGVSIGDNVVIGADSLVNKDLPANCLAAGSPARVLRENFPEAISAEEKQKLTEEMLTEFERYLAHNGFAVQREAGSFWIRGKKTSQLCWQRSATAVPAPQSEDNILLLSEASEDEVRGAGTRFRMVASLSSSSRIGRSDTGEELLAFLSRYGVRFNRLD
jgi:acetyltransferase-like isoleucine patch superfamily enzyme